jgi:3-dehydroquinate dehydratase
MTNSKKVNLKSLKDCDNLIGKNVSYYYGRETKNNIRQGLVQSYKQEGRKIWFMISNVCTDMHKIIETI